MITNSYQFNKIKNHLHFRRPEEDPEVRGDEASQPGSAGRSDQFRIGSGFPSGQQLDGRKEIGLEADADRLQSSTPSSPHHSTTTTTTTATTTTTSIAFASGGASAQPFFGAG